LSKGFIGIQIVIRKLLSYTQEEKQKKKWNAKMGHWEFSRFYRKLKHEPSFREI
jgi:hypothetical protein